MIVMGDARKIPVPDDSVQMVCTSPPYWGLRRYSGEQELVWGGREDCEHRWAEETENAEGYTGRKRWQHVGGRDGMPEGAFSRSIPQYGTCSKCLAWRGAYGLEPTVQMYVQHTVEILREIRRVLRPDGVCFWNIGDSYSSGGRVGHGTCTGYKQETNRGTPKDGWRPPCDEVKPKDLCLIPHRVAIAAQEDGWWVRNDIIWAKPNPMPESVTDRPTEAYEHILMLTKSARYFYDADAVREPYNPNSLDRYEYALMGTAPTARQPGGDVSRREREKGIRAPNPNGRNLRNVWTFPTQSYAEAHFATYPEELPRRCILAATSAWGACRFCGAPWERALEKIPAEVHAPNSQYGYGAGRNDGGRSCLVGAQAYTIGWRPTCLCRGQHGLTVPCLCLDPFGGSGTTLRVALELRRRCVSLDLAYHALAEERGQGVQTVFGF